MSGFSNGFRPQTCPEDSGNCLGCSFRTQGKRIFPLYENAMTDNCLCKPA